MPWIAKSCHHIPWVLVVGYFADPWEDFLRGVDRLLHFLQTPGRKRNKRASKGNMALKPNGKEWSIKEQIVEDPVSGLTLQFETDLDNSAPYRLRIFGNLPYGNREILFDVKGGEAAAGTHTGGTCRPSWMKKAD